MWTGFLSWRVWLPSEAGLARSSAVAHESRGKALEARIIIWIVALLVADVLLHLRMPIRLEDHVAVPNVDAVDVHEPTLVVAREPLKNVQIVTELLGREGGSSLRIASRIGRMWSAPSC